MCGSDAALVLSSLSFVTVILFVLLWPHRKRLKIFCKPIVDSCLRFVRPWVTSVANRLGLADQTPPKKPPRRMIRQPERSENDYAEGNQESLTIPSCSVDSFDSSNATDDQNVPPVPLSIRPLGSHEKVHNRLRGLQESSMPIYAVVHKENSRQTSTNKCHTLPSAFPPKSPVICQSPKSTTQTKYCNDSSEESSTSDSSVERSGKQRSRKEIIFVNDIYGQFGETAEPIYDQVP